MSKLPESDWERQKGNPQQQNTVCDNGAKGWYRFEGAAGTRMPTSCSPTHRCNSHLPGWLSCAHPTQADGQVYRTVFFHWYSDCCYKSITVKVINCGGYYVYYINGTPWCHLRYCGIDSIDAGRKNYEFCVIVLKIGYIYVYYTLVLLQVVNAL